MVGTGLLAGVCAAGGNVTGISTGAPMIGEGTACGILIGEVALGCEVVLGERLAVSVTVGLVVLTDIDGLMVGLGKSVLISSSSLG